MYTHGVLCVISGTRLFVIRPINPNVFFTVKEFTCNVYLQAHGDWQRIV